ncbi:MAG: nitrilase-related carbon-nitrogen hydrolase, partial [Bryobacteraceae bacterium]
MKLNRRSFVSSSALALAASPAGSSQTTPSPGTELRVGACQILTFPDTRRSAEKICSWIEKAATEKVDVVAFPEAAVCGYAAEPEYWKAANPRDFETAEASVVSTARKLNIAVVLGTAHWEGEKPYN